MVNLHVASSYDSVQLRFALLTVVLFGQIVLVKETHTAAVLPNRADVALHEEATQVISECFQFCCSQYNR